MPVILSRLVNWAFNVKSELPYFVRKDVLVFLCVWDRRRPLLITEMAKWQTTRLDLSHEERKSLVDHTWITRCAIPVSREVLLDKNQSGPLNMTTTFNKPELIFTSTPWSRGVRYCLKSSFRPEREVPLALNITSVSSTPCSRGVHYFLWSSFQPPYSSDRT